MDYIPYRQRCEQEEKTQTLDCQHEVVYGPVDHTYEERHKIEMRGVTWVVRVRRSAEILFFNVDTKIDDSRVKSFTSITKIRCGYSRDPTNLIEIDSDNSLKRVYSVIPYGRRFPKLMFFVDELGIDALDVLHIQVLANIVNIEIKPIVRPIQFEYPWPDFTSPGTSHDAVVTVDSVKFYVQKEYIGVWSTKLEQLLEDSNNELILENTDPATFELLLLHISPVRVDVPVEYFIKMRRLGEKLECPGVLAFIQAHIDELNELPERNEY